MKEAEIHRAGGRTQGAASTVSRFGDTDTTPGSALTSENGGLERPEPRAQVTQPAGDEPNVWSSTQHSPTAFSSTRSSRLAAIDRETAEGGRGLAAPLPNPDQSIRRARALRERAAGAIAAFATTEEELAWIHEQLAATSSDRGDVYRHAAQQARATAARAREMLRELTD